MNEGHNSSELLPPLSVEALNKVEIVERFASQAIRQCNNNDLSFNLEKAIRLLRTCAVQSFGAQLVHYTSLDNFSRDWLTEIREATIQSLLGLLPHSINKRR